MLEWRVGRELLARDAGEPRFAKTLSGGVVEVGAVLEPAD